MDVTAIYPLNYILEMADSALKYELTYGRVTTPLIYGISLLIRTSLDSFKWVSLISREITIKQLPPVTVD